jgi:NADPH:quinone reductase-like Zn-dependent oxidoreductase
LIEAEFIAYDEASRDGQLKPKVAKIFRFDEVVEAYRYMESNDQIGKIVLTLGE